MSVEAIVIPDKIRNSESKAGPTCHSSARRSILQPRPRSGEARTGAAARTAPVPGSGCCWDSVPRVSSLTAVFPFGCQVPQSGTLKLSHLREGTYTVQLTVMDTAGQRSSENVSVTVLPMAFSAGGEKKVLPRHSRRPTESRPLAEGWDWTGLWCSDCAFHGLFPFYFWLLSNDDKNRLYCTWG